MAFPKDKCRVKIQFLVAEMKVILHVIHAILESKIRLILIKNWEE